MATQKSKSRIYNFLDEIAGDKLVWIIVLCLCMISLLAIFSSTSQMATESNTRIDIIRGQLITVLGGIGIMFLLYKLGNMKVFRALSSIGFVFSFFLLLLLDLHVKTGFIRAAAINDAWRILVIGGLQIHVFEIVKVAMVMYLAWAIDKYNNDGFIIWDRIGNLSEKLDFMHSMLTKEIVFLFLPILIIIVMVLPGGNSSALFIAALLFLILLIGGVRFSHICVLGLLALLALGGCFGLYSLTKENESPMFQRIGTGISRVLNKSKDYETLFLESEKNSADYYKYLDKIRQPYSAKIAIKQGGFLGKGPGQSTQKYIVPVMYEDYIFSFIVEEYGLIGAIIVIVLYISLLARGSLITRNCRDGYAKMAVAGLVILITAQAMMHIVINCDIGLLTGQTLPMISHGTSSFICFSIAFGIILSISRMTAKKIEKEGEKSAPLMDLSEKDEVQGAMDDLDYYESLDEFQEPDIDNENE